MRFYPIKNMSSTSKEKNTKAGKPKRKKELRGAVRELKLSDEELEMVLTARSRSEWCEVRESGIHEKGLFAKRDIPKGARVIEYVGRMVSKVESQRRATAQEARAKKSGEGAVYIFTLNKKYDVDGCVPYNAARFGNHSCDPNCETDIIKGRVYLIALRGIKAGEEIAYDYNFDLDNWADHPCRCGSGKCVGYIVGREYWPGLKK